MPILGKQNQSGTSKRSSRKVKRSQEPVKTPLRSHDEFHTQHLFFFSFLLSEAKPHMPVLAAGPCELFFKGVLNSKKKKKKGPHLQALHFFLFQTRQK